MKRLLEKKGPLIPSDLWQEVERLQERNRQLQLKKGEERRANIEKVSELERQNENLMRRNQLIETERDEARANYDALLESSTHITNKLREEVTQLRSQLAAERADQEEIEAELASLAQIKKEAKEAAAEVHRSGRSIELEKVSGQQQLSDARADLADAQATILNQGNKIRELERGYTFKPNPAESALRLEIGNLQAELEAYKQQQPATELELPEPADLLNLLKTRRKKSTATLADVEKILEILEEGSNEPD